MKYTAERRRTMPTDKNLAGKWKHISEKINALGVGVKLIALNIERKNSERQRKKENHDGGAERVHVRSRGSMRLCPFAVGSFPSRPESPATVAGFTLLSLEFARKFADSSTNGTKPPGRKESESHGPHTT